MNLITQLPEKGGVLSVYYSKTRGAEVGAAVMPADYSYSVRGFVFPEMPMPPFKYYLTLLERAHLRAIFRFNSRLVAFQGF